MSDDVQVGSVVTLLSGSPQMTVGKIFKTAGGDVRAECLWYVSGREGTLGEIREAVVPMAALKAVVV